MLVPPSTNAPKGLAQTLNLIQSASDFLTEIYNDSQIIMDENASLADRIAAYNSLAQVDQSVDFLALNGVGTGVQTFFSGFEDKMNAYMETVKVVVPSPGGGTTQLKHGKDDATLKDVIDAMNGKTSNDFSISADLGHGHVEDCGWLPKKDVEKAIDKYSDGIFGSGWDFGGYTGGGDHKDGDIDWKVSQHTHGCHRDTYSVEAHGSAQAWEQAGAYGVKTQGTDKAYQNLQEYYDSQIA